MTSPGENESLEAARRRGDAAAAGHTGDEAAARAFLTDPDAEVRAAALGALVRMGRATPQDAQQPASRTPIHAPAGTPASWVPTLPGADFAALLDDPDDIVVEAACYAVGEVGDSRAVPEPRADRLVPLGRPLP